MSDQHASQPITYYDAASTRDGRTWLDARARYDELNDRHHSASARAILVARGDYDPAKHGTSDPAPLSLAEHLEVLANGEVVARVYRHPAQVHRAVKAGASWQQIADATGSTEAEARQDYREWAEGQRQLAIDYDGRFGMDPAEYDAAIAAADHQDGDGQDPEPDPGDDQIITPAAYPAARRYVRGVIAELQELEAAKRAEPQPGPDAS